VARYKNRPGQKQPVGAAKPRALAEWTDSTAALPPSATPLVRGRARNNGIPIPDANPRWHPQAQSWFNSLKISGQSEFYEASDWAMAVVAAQTYDLFMRTYREALLLRFDRLSARLGACIADRNAARIRLEGEPQPVADEDEEAADAVVLDWRRKFNQKHGEQEGGGDG
jgi:hypothetical protein